MTSPRKKWNNDKKVEMQKLHELLAADGAPDSQLYIAIKLVEEALKEKSQLKTDTATEMLINLAMDGNRMAISMLSELARNNVSLSSRNRMLLSKILSRNELEVESEAIANTILTTICDNQSRRSTESEFRQRIQRLVLQTNPTPTSDTEAEERVVDENILSRNICLVMKTKSPFIDLSDDMNFRDLFSIVFNTLRISFAMIDLTFITFLMISFRLSLIVNYFFFRPNFRLLYQSFFDYQTICLSLQLIEVYSFVRLVERISNYKNYKLWVKVIRAFDKESKLEATKFFDHCSQWFFVFLITLGIELLLSENFHTIPTISSSVIRQMMAFLSLLVLIKYNSNVFQIFLVIFHYLCKLYLPEIQTHLPLIYDNITKQTMILTIILVIITTKPILSSISFHLVVIPNLLTHILIVSTDYDSESLNFLISNVFKNIHSVFGGTILLVFLKITGKLHYLALIPRLLVFTDFYKHLNKALNWSTIFINFSIICYFSHRIVRVSFFRGMAALMTIFFISGLFLSIVSFNERQISAIAKNTYSYDRYYDKCVVKQELSHNISQQIECLDITLNHKLQALSEVKLIKLTQINNYMKNYCNFFTMGFSDFFYGFLPKKVQKRVNLNDWRVLEFVVIFQLKHSGSQVSVLLEHQNRDFVEKLKVGDIYQIEMFYDPIKGTAVLLSAKCKTCWDVIQWNNTVFY